MMRLVLMLYLLPLAGAQQQLNCVKDVNYCSCVLDDGRTIDLSPLDTGGATPRFADVADITHGDMWSYNPCSPFTESNCFNVAACQVRQADSYTTAYQDSASFETDPTDGLRIKYTAETDAYRTTYVQLLCNPNDEGTMTADGEKIDGSAEYYLAISSKHCCPKGGDGPTDPTNPPDKPTPASNEDEGGISPGTIVLIVVLVFFSVYLTSGILVQRVARHKQGREMVPNVNFWIAIPGLIKEGNVFLYQQIRHKCSKTDYEQK